jgi:hypothetical protein
MNGLTMMVMGYCQQCSANMQLQHQLNAANNSGGLNDLDFTPPGATWDREEKEVIGERLPDVPLIEHKD